MKNPKVNMKAKKIVTTVVAVLAICMTLCIPSEAAFQTSKSRATIKATIRQMRYVQSAQTMNYHWKVNTYSDEDLKYMTSIIYCEARGESYAGKKAVGIVVMNRVKSNQFPNNIKDVIYQRGQFSPTRNGSLNRALGEYDSQMRRGRTSGVMAECQSAAEEALNGSTSVNINGRQQDMGSYLFFSRYIRNARFQLGAHQFK